MNNSFRYSLGKIVGVCPQCGRRCFKPYVDNLTGRPLDRRFCGRCNRENSCRYHLPPAQWFRENGAPRPSSLSNPRPSYHVPRTFENLVPPRSSLSKFHVPRTFENLALRAHSQF